MRLQRMGAVWLGLVCQGILAKAKRLSKNSGMGHFCLSKKVICARNEAKNREMEGLEADRVCLDPTNHFWVMALDQWKESPAARFPESKLDNNAFN